MTQDARIVDVIGIGAGIAGIALAVNLRKNGVTSFEILEQSDGIGGTWWDNRYPGAEVDVISHLYSFSFAPHPFTRTHARQPEVRDYLHRVVRDHGVEDHFVLGTKVDSVTWDAASERWDVLSSDGRRWNARHVVASVGQLNNPRYPQWPGMDRFRGEIFHTARWRDDVDLRGRRVALVGTGSTSAQVTPPVAEIASHLTVFQRQPGWVIDKGDHDYAAAQLARWTRFPWLMRLARLRAFMGLERMKDVAKQGSRLNLRFQRQAEAYLERAVQDPVLRAQLTPDHPYFGKRPVITSDYYPALQRPNVTLVPHEVVAMTESGVVDDRGVETEADVVVLATGFLPSQFLATLNVVGEDGVRLSEHWGPDPRSFLGIMSVHFPNFYVTYGPKTNGGTVIFTLERQAEWIARSVRVALRRDATVRIRPEVVEEYEAKIDRALQRTVWASTRNYYTSSTGKIVTQWPLSQRAYAALLRRLPVQKVATLSPRPPGSSTGGRPSGVTARVPANEGSRKP